jgi:hypothetical protein
VDQDQLNPYVAYEGYVVRVPHNPLVKPQVISGIAQTALTYSLTNMTFVRSLNIPDLNNESPGLNQSLNSPLSFLRTS